MTAAVNLKALAASVLAVGLPLPVGVAKPIEWLGEIKLHNIQSYCVRVMFVDEAGIAAAEAEGCSFLPAKAGEWKYLPRETDVRRAV